MWYIQYTDENGKRCRHLCENQNIRNVRANADVIVGVPIYINHNYVERRENSAPKHQGPAA